MDPDFLPNNENALRKRIYRFIERENLVHRRRTHIAQSNRRNVDAEQDFLSVVNDYISMLNIPASMIVNIDETNVDFDQPSSITLSRRGQRTISVRGTGSSYRCTALLGVTMTGEKLPAFIVFTGTRNGRIIREISGEVVSRGFPSDVVMSVQKNGWMDEELMIEWIDRVWKPWLQQKQSGLSYLMMDCFKVFTSWICFMDDLLSICGYRCICWVLSWTDWLIVAPAVSLS